jgi:hypothetical protein
VKSLAKWERALRISSKRRLVKDESRSESEKQREKSSREISFQKSSPVFSLLGQIPGRSVKYKIVAFVSAIAYWLLYAYSAGMFFYYSFDVTQYIREEGIPNPSFGLDLSSLSGFYNSGLVWYPTGHLALILFMGPMIFSIVLSVLFALSIVLIAYNIRLQGRIRKSGGLVGFLGIIPAIFTGGCCSVPLATLLLGSIVPSTVLLNIEFDNPFLLNFLTVLLMVSAVIYTARKANALDRSCSS